MYLHYEVINQDEQNEKSDDQQDEMPDDSQDEGPNNSQDERKDDHPGEQNKEEPDVDDNDMKVNNTKVESKMEKLLVKVDDTYDYVWKMYVRFKVNEAIRKILQYN